MPTPKPHIAIPRTVWALGFVSLFMDLSSELIHSLLPVFLVTTLGASAFSVGLIEGLGESVALITKVFSGALSDFIGRRKGLILLGYGMAALTKPLFPLARSVEAVLTARLLDRVGKGIRGAPRDALVADVTPPAIRGAAFGLRQSMDTVGAFLGPVLAIGLMFLFHGDMRQVFWVAVVPAVLAVVLIVTGVDDTRDVGASGRFRSPLRLATLRELSPGYWWVVAIGAVFTLARFSEAFLVLRAQQTGLALTWIPLVLVVMNVVYALSAYPAGALSDRLPRTTLLIAGLGVLIVADLILARATSSLLVLCGVAAWGLHLGLTQGILAALLADTAPANLKGTAFGLFNLVSGFCLLLASALAGWLWDRQGAASTFYTGGALATVAAIMMLARRRRASDGRG
ncbi:MAG: MFS transporter [Gemmatimonadota bacterium]|nr:MFS transporter [Gemmatimonadota bacterium]